MQQINHNYYATNNHIVYDPNLRSHKKQAFYLMMQLLDAFNGSCRQQSKEVGQQQSGAVGRNFESSLPLLLPDQCGVLSLTMGLVPIIIARHWLHHCMLT